MKVWHRLVPLYFTNPTNTRAGAVWHVAPSYMLFVHILGIDCVGGLKTEGALAENSAFVSI